jgi:hypothetical protein
MIYDYKSDELTQEVYIQCICPLCEDIIDEYSTLRRYENLSIYAPSYIAREIIGRLLEEVDDLWVHTDSDISLIYADGNDLVVTIACDGMIFIESAKNNDVIKSNEDCCLTYFYDGLGQKDLNALEENAESILVFGFEEDDCEGCKSEDIELATTSTASYTVNGKSVTKEEFDKKYAEFENKYLDNVRDMLLNYCDLMDSFNDWQKRFW